MHVVSALLCLALLAGPAQLLAEIYKWTDASGRIHFSDQAPDGEQTPSLEQVALPPINSYQRVEVSDYSGGAAPLRQVIMYSTSWCGYCRKAREYFAANTIPYQERDIETSAAARREYHQLDGRGVPVILVGKKRMNGFSASRFAALYAN